MNGDGWQIEHCEDGYRLVVKELTSADPEDFVGVLESMAHQISHRLERVRIGRESLQGES